MDRLLLSKAAVVEYFRVHASDKRRLSVRERSVTNEVCSVLDPVAEVNIKVQGAEDTYISQATFLMTELLAIMESGPFRIRTLDKPQVEPVPYDDVETSNLCGEVRTAVDVCVKYKGKKNLGEVGNLVERISTLLDPRRKTLSKQECVNGKPDVKQLAINELKDVADLFEGSAPQQTTAPAPAPASALAPAPAPASAPAPGGNGATGPLAKKPRVLSVMEQRRANRLAAAGSAGAAGDEAESGSGPSTTHKVRVLQELTRYVAEGVELEEDGFSLPGFWLRRGPPKLSQATGEVIEEAAMPHLALLARLYHEVEATSCQAERNFSDLALLIGNMRSSMGAFKVGQMMFLRLNQRCIPEIGAYNRVIDTQQARRNQCREDTDKAQDDKAGGLIEIDL